MSATENNYFKGRGSQVNTQNPFQKQTYVTEHKEVLDEELYSNGKTHYFFETPKKIINKVKSPDVYSEYSMNPYQGCEHGCIYCYARNSHEYWGFSAGLDFERKIIIKQNAPELLEKQLMNKNWKVSPIMFSGNTDCYQPIEKKLEMTRKMLKVLLKFKQPVGMITKNSLILRDIDLLSEMAKLKLVHVMVSITSLKEDLRLAMEPRTTTAKQRLKVIEELNKAGIPAGVMTAPIIPGLNSEEIPSIIVGMIYTFDILFEEDANKPLKDFLRAPIFLPNSTSIEKAFLTLKHKRQSYAVVTDARGEAVGAVPIEKLLVL